MYPLPDDDMDSTDGEVRDTLLMRSRSEDALKQLTVNYASIPSESLLAPASSLHRQDGNSVNSQPAKQTPKMMPYSPSRRRGQNRNGIALWCYPQTNDGGDSVANSDESEDDFEFVVHAKEILLGRTDNFDLPNCPERGFRATTFSVFSMSRPYMRAMHASWICFFASYSVQFAMAPLLPQLELSLNLSKQDIWLSNVWMVVGGIPMRFILGPLCDTHGPRFVMCVMLLACAIPCALSGLLIFNLPSLLFVRFIIGSMDAFVPSQCWITTMFVRECTGTIMAIVAGLGASGSAFSQLLVGFLFDGWSEWTNGDDDLAWKLTLIFPAAFAFFVATWAYLNSDDCPLGNFLDVKRAGLMLERSAVDSFRSGVVNLNSWLLCVQYAFSSGVDTTLCNGIAMYYHVTYHQKISRIGAIAALYGCSALWARGLGGYISDKIGNRFSLAGRLWVHFFFMITQGGANIWFARSEELNASLFAMTIFSILIQISTGTCYGIVPFIDSANTGSVAGIVGGGGNVGAVVLGLVFMCSEYQRAFVIMSCCTIASALLTPFIVVKGYKGMLFGKDDHDDPSRKQQSPLLVPKMRHSPHFVKLKRRPHK
ncbi:high affinity nitrate/nitrite transporter transmembrane protein [Nitzschia inconspicua]|uniref:High affinity nitrate/nitrite transporter transmembrane protein n=1 Tax=Nitzschia inconspicua TaxID=303405 RepID=A0A9K3LBR4_9STRA|nr:high affinity nitrate/nitrite transporter transmembrane protein [Nitzschia inconspicua]